MSEARQWSNTTDGLHRNMTVTIVTAKSDILHLTSSHTFILYIAGYSPDLNVISATSGLPQWGQTAVPLP